MAADDTELTFIRCPSCKSLVPALASRCRMCGHTFDRAADAPAGDAPHSAPSDPSPSHSAQYPGSPTQGAQSPAAPANDLADQRSRVRQRTVSISPSEVQSFLQKGRAPVGDGGGIAYLARGGTSATQGAPEQQPQRSSSSVFGLSTPPQTPAHQAVEGSQDSAPQEFAPSHQEAAPQQAPVAYQPEDDPSLRETVHGGSSLASWARQAAFSPEAPVQHPLRQVSAAPAPESWDDEVEDELLVDEGPVNVDPSNEQLEQELLAEPAATTNGHGAYPHHAGELHHVTEGERDFDEDIESVEQESHEQEIPQQELHGHEFRAHAPQEHTPQEQSIQEPHAAFVEAAEESADLVEPEDYQEYEELDDEPESAHAEAGAVEAVYHGSEYGHDQHGHVEHAQQEHSQEEHSEVGTPTDDNTPAPQPTKRKRKRRRKKKTGVPLLSLSEQQPESLESPDDEGDDDSEVEEEPEEQVPDQRAQEQTSQEKRSPRGDTVKEKDMADSVHHSSSHSNGVSTPGAVEAPESSEELCGWLVSFNSPRTLSTELRAGRFFIGQHKLRADDMVVNDPSVSVPHCLVAVDPIEGVIVQDLMSEGGTFVRKGASGDDFERITVPTPLAHGDTVRFGTVEFMICIVPHYLRQASDR